MENKETIESYVKNNSSNEIICKNSSITTPIIIIAAAIGIYLIVRSGMIENESLYMLISCVYVVLFGYGIYDLIIRLSGKRSKYILACNKKKLCKKKIYINTAEIPIIKTCIDKKNFSEIKKIKTEYSSNAYIDAWGTDDGNYYFFQIYEYIPHNYEPISDVINLQGTDANNLHNLVKQVA